MSGAEVSQFTVTLSRLQRYRFQAEFDDAGVGPLRLDESPPLGEGLGPNPSRLLAAAIGNCLAASLLFCLEKARVPVEGLRARVQGTYVRNEAGRLRLGAMRVTLEPELGEAVPARLDRCLEIFEDFCIVTQSIREGVPIDVEVLRPSVVDAVSAEA
jgi:uncharacterized OsmC-like protein